MSNFKSHKIDLVFSKDATFLDLLDKLILKEVNENLFRRSESLCIALTQDNKNRMPITCEQIHLKLKDYTKESNKLIIIEQSFLMNHTSRKSKKHHWIG